MVKYFMKFAMLVIIIFLLTTTACRKQDFPPSFTEALPDTINICKNGWCTFYLSKIAEDGNDAVDSLTWSVMTGSLLTTRFIIDDSLGRGVELVPLPNQIGKTSAIFSAVDPTGLSISKTCTVFVFEPIFKIWFTNSDFDTINIRKKTMRVFSKTAVIREYDSRLKPKSTLVWYDTTEIQKLTVDIRNDSLIFNAHNTPCTTGVYFRIIDDSNHVTFPYSVLVFIRP